MRTWLCVVLALASGCIVPRSMTLGQMAAPVGAGATDLGVYSGVLYASQTTGAFQGQDSLGDPQTSQDKTNGFSIPAFEANLQHGFSDHVALNVHASAAGIQPGVKLTLNKSNVAHVALLPAFGIGYASVGGTTSVAGADGVLQEGNPRSQTSFTVLAGLKLLTSVRFGRGDQSAAFFGGVGYDFLFNRNFNSSQIGANGTEEIVKNIVQTLSHQISVSVGVDIPLGWVHLRPEVAFAVYPGVDVTRTAIQSTTEVQSHAGGGFGFAIFPGFTLALTTPAREPTDEEKAEAAEAARKEKLRRHRTGDDEDDDDDDEVKPPPRKRGSDDEDDQPRRRRDVDLTDDEDP